MSLFTDAGRGLLWAAEREGSSRCAHLVRVFEKQKTPTSCGVCCAVVAANFLALCALPPDSGRHGEGEGRGELGRGGEGRGGGWAGDGALRKGAPLPLLSEALVLSQCCQLISGVEDAVLHQHGLTLRQVCRWDVRVARQWARPSVCPCASVRIVSSFPSSCFPAFLLSFSHFRVCAERAKMCPNTC